MKRLTYGQWLRGKRRELGLTQGDVETRTGVGDKALSKIEHDLRRPTAETRAEIHRVLNTTETELAEIGILEEIGKSGRYDWPRGNTGSVPPSATVTRSDALAQIRDAAGDMRWTQSMVDAIVQQVRVLREMQAQSGIE